jgi:hypothetical protein
MLRISAGSPSKLGVAFADRMGNDIATILAIGDMWNLGFRGVVRCRVEDDRVTNRQIRQATRTLWAFAIVIVQSSNDSQGLLCHYIPPAQVLSYR